MRVLLITLIYLFFPLLIVSAFYRWKILQKVGTVMMAYAVGLLMALTGFVNIDPDTNIFQFFLQIEDAVGWQSAGSVLQQKLLAFIQQWIMNLAVPLAIPLLLFNADFKLWTKSLPKTFAVLLGGLLAVLVAVISSFFIFRHSGINHLSQVSALMTSIYTGGTMNFFALGAALHVDASTMTMVYTFEMLITFPLVLFIVGGGFRLFRKILPSPNDHLSVPDSQESEQSAVIEDYSGMLSWRTFSKLMFALLLSVLFLLIGAGLSILISGKTNEMIIILTITTLSIIASFFKKVRTLPKTFELGMIFILMFSIVVASQFNIHSLHTTALPLVGFVLYVMFASVIVHIIFCRLYKVDGDLFTVSLVSLLCSPPFIPPVVSAMGNKKVLISGIAIGLIGYAIGTYLGVSIAYLLALF